jgi:DNA-binding NtrC family response regulator
MVKTGQFREDLWFRLNVFPIHIPPLRQRKEDIPELAHHFIEKKSIELRLYKAPGLAPHAIDRLMSYDWPGNVRELENIVERGLIRYKTGDLDFADLMADVDPRPSPPAQTAGTDEFIGLDELTSRHIRQALRLSSGKINGPSGAADLLKIHPNTLRKKMEKLHISYKRKK